jgi:hypothetical protein
VQEAGRVAALEILIVNAAVSNLIREGKTFPIASVMQTGKKQGMVTLHDALVELVAQKLTEPDEACKKAAQPAELAKLLEARGIQVALPEGAWSAAFGASVRRPSSERLWSRCAQRLRLLVSAAFFLERGDDRPLDGAR